MLYSRTWLFIHFMYTGLHLLIPNLHSFSPLPLHPLGTGSYFFLVEFARAHWTPWVPDALTGLNYDEEAKLLNLGPTFGSSGSQVFHFWLFSVPQWFYLVLVVIAHIFLLFDFYSNLLSILRFLNLELSSSQDSSFAFFINIDLDREGGGEI